MLIQACGPASSREAAPKPAPRLLEWSAVMPKMKTHSGAKKRFKKTATGKLRGKRAYSSHMLEHKSPKRKRAFSKPTEVAAPDIERVSRLLNKRGGR